MGSSHRRQTSTNSMTASTAEIVLSAVAYVFIGLASILAMLMVTYFILKIADLLGTRRNEPLPLATERLNRTIERSIARNNRNRTIGLSKTSPVTLEAGLLSMSEIERQRVLQQVFQTTTTTYCGDKEKRTGNDEIDQTEDSLRSEMIKQEKDYKDGNIENSGEMADNKDDSLASLNTNTSKQEDRVTTDKGKEDGQGQGDCCSICLSEFRDGCKVMTPRASCGCNHLFHYDCCMEWLLKEHDLCPYCRKQMMTAEELILVAKKVLGKQRVMEIQSVSHQLCVDAGLSNNDDNNNSNRNNTSDDEGGGVEHDPEAGSQPHQLSNNHNNGSPPPMLSSLDSSSSNARTDTEEPVGDVELVTRTATQ